jgi:hypothetical protein
MDLKKKLNIPTSVQRFLFYQGSLRKSMKKILIPRRVGRDSWFGER